MLRKQVLGLFLFQHTEPPPPYSDTSAQVQTRRLRPIFVAFSEKLNFTSLNTPFPLCVKFFFLKTLYLSKIITLGQDSVIATVYQYRVAYVEVHQDFQFS